FAMLVDSVNRQPHHCQPVPQLRRTQPGVCKLLKPVITNKHLCNLWMALLEFFQKPHIVLKQQPYVVELVHQPAHPIDAEAKSESGILLRIDTNHAQHVGMHHAATTQLDPTGVFADATAAALAFEATEIKLSTRFGEREIRWSKTRDRVGAKHLPEQFTDRAFQVRHRDAAVDTQSFDLKEHRIVRRIRSVASKYSSRCNHSNRNAAALHCVYLHGRGLRTKRKAIDRVERISLSARGMVLRNV